MAVVILLVMYSYSGRIARDCDFLNCDRVIKISYRQEYEVRFGIDKMKFHM